MAWKVGGPVRPFNGLREGRYTIEVEATGFKDGKVEKIPAGTENVAVQLKRSG